MNTLRAEIKTSGARMRHVVRRIETPELERERKVALTGICANCENAAGCSYIPAAKTKYFCEEFTTAKAEPLVAIGSAPEVSARVVDTKLGLCANCDLRESCRYPKPEGGVWFCGEYQ